MKKIKIISRWYKYFLFIAIAYIAVMSILQIVSEFRIFSVGHILLCVSIMFSMYLSFKYFKVILKLWGALLVLSGGLIMLSSIMYILTGSFEKISLMGNLLATINFVIGIILHKYFEGAVRPVE